MFALDVEDALRPPEHDARGRPAGPPSATIPASDDVVLVRRALGELAGVDPSQLPEAQALADMSALLAARRELDAVLLRRLADVDARRLHRLDASPTTSAWVRAQGSPVDAATVTLAKRLSRLPGVQDAVRDGQLSVAAAARVSAALSKLRPLVDRPDGLIDGQPGDAVVTAVVVDGVLDLCMLALGGLPDDDPRVSVLADELSEVSCWPTSQLARLEAAFVLLAAHLPAADLPGALSQLVDALLPLQLEKRAARGADEAGLTLTRKSDGSGWLLRGDLDLETGEFVFTALTAMQGVDPENRLDTAAWQRLRDQGWEPGDPVPDDLGPQDRTAGPDQSARLDGLVGQEDVTQRNRACAAPRSCARRLHDALRLTLRAALDAAALGQRDKAAPHIDVTIGLAALNKDPGALPATGGSGATLPLSLVRSWWCNASVTRFVLGLGRRVLSMSHSQRTLTAAERRLKRVETAGRCQGAGCGCGPGHGLVPHHVDAYCRTGTTVLQETVMLCDQTHGELHRGLTITLEDGRRLNAEGWVE